MSSYSYDLKIEALKLSDQIGIKATAEKLGIPSETVARWRKSRNRPKLDAYAETFKKQEDTEALKREITKLRRTNDILLEAIRHLTAAHEI